MNIEIIPLEDWLLNVPERISGKYLAKTITTFLKNEQFLQVRVTIDNLRRVNEKNKLLFINIDCHNQTVTHMSSCPLFT